MACYPRIPMIAPARRLAGLLLAVLASLLLVGCTPRQLVVGSMADALAGQGRGSENDLELARDAAPFYLKLSESVLQQQPGHLALAESVAGGFTQYAYAFVASEADRLESVDSKGAERIRQRAARLYQRAQRHAVNALELANSGFVRRLASPQPEDWPRLKPEEVGLAYWAAASWGGWISLSKDDPEVVADLPLAVRLAQLAWASDPAWGQGSLTSLLATFEVARPGGSPARALALFDQAIAQSAGRSAGALLAKAEGHAQPAGDRALFEQLLRQALAIKDAPASPLAMQNEVMRRRAAWLLEKTDDLF